MVEYLIKHFKDEFHLASLSRGYKRKTSGFQLANEDSTVEMLGDEPFVFHQKFPNITVAVDADRRNGIQQLLRSDPSIELILLDDAFQHRWVKAGLNIMLSTFQNPYFKDIVLPTGELREGRYGAQRADIIVITKCPADLKLDEKEDIILRIKPKAHQLVAFSKIEYDSMIYSEEGSQSISQLKDHSFTLVTGIANDSHLVDHLHSLTLEFDHHKYSDHYDFKEDDLKRLNNSNFILTTEKDYVRLKGKVKSPLYYLPIIIKFDDEDKFKKRLDVFLGRS